MSAVRTWQEAAKRWQDLADAAAARVLCEAFGSPGATVYAQASAPGGEDSDDPFVGSEYLK